MSRNFCFLVLAAGLFSAALLFNAPAEAAVRVGLSVNTADFGFLGSYGSWIHVPARGQVWRPTVVAGWSPYAQGEWVWSDQGWTWTSNEPFGWVVYHYGDWTYEPGYGWVWVPGYDWSPARVHWIYYGDYVGWAPLGVAAREPWMDARYWHVVRVGDLNRSGVHAYFVSRPAAPLRTIHVVRTAPTIHEFERVTNRRLELTRFTTVDVRGGTHVFKRVEVQRSVTGSAGSGRPPLMTTEKEVKVKKKKHVKHKPHHHD